MSPDLGDQKADLIVVVVAVCRPKVLDHEGLARGAATSKNLQELKQGRKKREKYQVETQSKLAVEEQCRRLCSLFSCYF